jgi:hypothetical protein
MSEHFTCVACGRSYILSYEHQNWFLNEGLEIPKRCKDCRDRRQPEKGLGNKGLSGPPIPSTGTRRWPTEFFEEQQPKTKSPPAWRPNPVVLLGLGLVLLAIIATLYGLSLWLGWI